MNGSVQRTIPNVVFPFRSMIPKTRSAAYYGSEYQLGHYVPTDILPSCVHPSGSLPRTRQARLILPAVPDGPAFGLRPAVSEKPFIMETKYQVPHNAAPDILIGVPASLLLLACSPRPGVARQHERFPENDSPWLHLKSEPAERPIQRLRPVAHERRQRERHGPRPGCGITERPSPTLVVAVYEIIPSISFASPTAVRNINWNIMFQLIFPVVGSFFSLSLRSPMVMIRFPGVVLLLGFF